MIDIKDYLYDLKYRTLAKFEAENKCEKCDMCIDEKVSYEYDEWESYCLNGKDIYDIEYCFIPLFISKVKAKLFKEKILKSDLDAMVESYADMADWFEKEENDKSKKDSIIADMV